MDQRSLARRSRIIGATRRSLAVLAGAALMLFSARPGSAQTFDPNVWATNGQVNAVAFQGNKVFIGGSFSQVGPATGGGVPVNATTGAAASGFPKVAGTVRVAIPDGSGGWFIGGGFTAVGGIARQNLAHILSNLSVASWDPSPNNTVIALLRNGTTLYVGGVFTTIGGQNRSYVAAVDTSGLATGWNPNANGFVHALGVSGATVYAGGEFTSIGGQFRFHIAALDAASGLATAWNPNALGNVYSLVVSGTTIYAGGAFTNVGGQTRNHLAALDASSGLPTAFDPDANGDVNVLLLSGTQLYAGGAFTTIGGQPRHRIAAVELSNWLATVWNPDADNDVYGLEMASTTMRVAGAFATIGGQPRGRFAEVDIGSGLATAWDPNAFGALAYTVAASGSRVYVGGSFTSLGPWVARLNLAALDAATGAATPWNPGPDRAVHALAIDGSTVYAGGTFTNIGGQPRNRIAALDAGTGLATAWNPGASDTVFALAIRGATVYAGGSFTTVGGQPRNRIAALNPATGLATGWNPVANDIVRALAPAGAGIYAGGDFTAIGGQPRNRIAALDAGTGLATTWNPDASDRVDAIAVSGATVYAGGGFASVGSQSRNRIAALDATTGLATAWNPNANDRVRALFPSENTVYAGGDFTNIGGRPRSRIAALDSNGGAATPWDTFVASGSVRALAMSYTTLYAVGGFNRVNLLPQMNVAAFDAAPGLFAIQPSSAGGATVAMVTISGHNIEIGSSVKLARSGQPDIVGTGVIIDGDGFILLASLDLNGAKSGVWDVVVTAPDSQNAILPRGFTVLKAVVNEFLPRPAVGRAEFYELLNESGATLDLDHWTLSASGVVDTIRNVVIADGAYYVDSTFAAGFLPDHAAALVLRDPGGVIVDQVAYGDSGGAPVFPPSPKSITTARLPNGADTDQDGGDFNATAQPTPGVSNLGVNASTTLGTSVFISRIYMHGTGQDAIELYNPLPQPLDVTGFLLTDGGDNVESILGVTGTSIGVLQPQQKRWLKQGDPGSFNFDITYDTCLRLYAPGRVPIEYIGWKQVPAYDPDLCVSRTPTPSDGYHNGYDFTTSGGPQYLQFRSCDIVGDRTAVAEPAAALSFLGAVPTPTLSSGSTVMAFAVPGSPGGTAQHVRLRLFDVAGRHVQTVYDGALRPGSHRVPFQCASAKQTLSPGVYLALLEVGRAKTSRHVVVLH